MKSKHRAASAASKKRPKQQRKMRPRPTPRWIESEEIEEIARRRCLMILSVLSGEKPVTEAIKEAEITRPLYYLLERRALDAMVLALIPGSGPGRKPEISSQIRALEEKIQTLEKEKRRMERLLFMTRKLMKPGPMKTRTGLMKSGRPKKKTTTSSPTTETSDTRSPSIPTTTGETKD